MECAAIPKPKGIDLEQGAGREKNGKRNLAIQTQRWGKKVQKPRGGPTPMFSSVVLEGGP